ncbi:hypothetical protein G7050_02515 [Dysgonomonas sp. HDW5A]|uniref:hypothetical protein n=1 Tax=Dysgonomonas sp. HDW5A TaxID=2714926 RepID=UPI00140CEC08|nr:hypothetical protein [Dysgonomonas sp. HDW5A]QIK58772.1 hypothetical protein G7050_02515 [Dysgonomonas sp. HDW5A]
MKKKSPFKTFIRGAAVAFGCVVILSIFMAIGIYTAEKKGKAPQKPTSQDLKELNEMRVYHSPKGLVEVEDGLIIIRR